MLSKYLWNAWMILFIKNWTIPNSFHKFCGNIRNKEILTRETYERKNKAQLLFLSCPISVLDEFPFMYVVVFNCISSWMTDHSRCFLFISLTWTAVHRKGKSPQGIMSKCGWRVKSVLIWSYCFLVCAFL